MAKKYMHTYVSQLKDTELETLIDTYDIPLDLRLRLPDPNFRMINLLAGDTTIGIYSRIFDSSGVRILFSSFLPAVIKHFKVHISQLVPLGLSKVITFEVLYRSLNIEPTVTLFQVFQTLSKQGDWFSFAKRGDPAPVYMEDKVPTNFNQNHVDRLKAHIVKLRDILERVLVRSGISRVWHNPMCDPVLRRSNNTGIYDFLCMPSLDKVTVREEPHGLDTSILDRVVDRTTSPALAGTAIPPAFLEEITVTRPDLKVVTKADNAAKRKASTGPDISTNATKNTRSSKKGSGAEFSMEDIESLNHVNQDKEFEPHGELSEGVRRNTRAGFRVEYASPRAQEAAPALDDQPLDADVDAHKIAIDGSGSESPPYPKDDWEEIHGCAQQTHTIKKQSADLKQQNESTVHANEEVSRSERDALAIEKAKIKEELVETKSQLEHHERQAEEIQDSIASFFQSDFPPLVQRVDGFIPDAKEKFDRAVIAFPATTFPFLDNLSQNSQCSLQDITRLEHNRVMSSHQTTTTIASLRANTHVRHFTSSSWTFGYTSTLEHSKKKKKSVET
ncbi:hypothetical protein Tco_1244486 [Tanacetum coccineum]